MKIQLLLACLLACASPALSQLLTARIKLDADRQIGEISPLIYGNFVEHLGRCVYGGIYDPKSPQADADGFRKDVAQATRDLGVTNIRYPGGNFVSGYHWTDGVGPRADRPKRKDLAWGDIEPNHVGTDEFMAFSRLTGIEPYFCINAGTGTLEEARSWVEYCNGTGTAYAEMRARNGHPAPYKIKYWGLGNEMDGDWQMGHKNAEDYSKFALEAAKLMKWADPEIKLIASGSSDYSAGKWVKWNRTILDGMASHIDYIGLHFYIGDWGGMPPGWSKDPRYFLARITEAEEKIRITEGLLAEVKAARGMEKDIHIAFDEWNVWYRVWNEGKLEERYDFQDALMVAQYLNMFVRHANSVKIANMAQLVNVIAPMFVENDRLWLQTTYFPFQLFAKNCRGISLDAFVDCPTYDVKQFKKIPYLDVSAAWDKASGEMVLNVVNRHPEQAISTDVFCQSGEFAPGKATVYELNNKDLYAVNSLAGEAVRPVEKQVSVAGAKLNYSFPAHSFTMLKLKCR